MSTLIDVTSKEATFFILQAYFIYLRNFRRIIEKNNFQILPLKNPKGN